MYKDRMLIILFLVYLINVILISIIHAEIALDSASNALNQFGLKLLAVSRISQCMYVCMRVYSFFVNIGEECCIFNLCR